MYLVSESDTCDNGYYDAGATWAGGEEEKDVKADDSLLSDVFGVAYLRM